MQSSTARNWELPSTATVFLRVDTPGAAQYNHRLLLVDNGRGLIQPQYSTGGRYSLQKYLLEKFETTLYCSLTTLVSQTEVLCRCLADSHLLEDERFH